MAGAALVGLGTYRGLSWSLSRARCARIQLWNSDRRNRNGFFLMCVRRMFSARPSGTPCFQQSSGGKTAGLDGTCGVVQAKP